MKLSLHARRWCIPALHAKLVRAARLSILPLLFTATLQAQNWTQLITSPVPLGRQNHAMAYDSQHDQIVLFGGQANGNFLPGDTWTWDGLSWSQRTSAAAPAARNAAAMAYDVQHGSTVLFGGGNPSGLQSDTWEWRNGSWQSTTPAHQPPARYFHAMAYDAVRARIVLFGGFGSAARNDTWEWDGSDWTQRQPLLSPPPRYATALAYDSQRQRIVLFGGFDGTTQLGDTWEWDGLRWTQATPFVSPAARSGHAMVYDALRGHVVLFGGFHTTELGDTWAFDGITWTQLTPSRAPSARSGQAMAFDSQRARVVLFGGAISGTSIGETWVLPLPSARAFGTGCGAPPLDLAPAPGSLPVLGQTFTSLITNLPAATSSAFLALGASDRMFGTFMLPLDLTFLGLPGCWLYQDLLIPALPAQLVGNGMATQSLPLPPTPSLAGARVFAQSWVIAPGVNAAGLLFSNALELTLGN